MALADGSVGVHADTLSNEEMYHKVWATFVDGVVERERQASPEGGRGRIELRDVMRLEEVLAKIENAEGGWIDYEGRQTVGALRAIGGTEMELSSIGSVVEYPLEKTGRQSPERKPGLPPMFQNPGASFLASMYNPVSVHGDRNDRRSLPTSPRSVQASRNSGSGSGGSAPTRAALGEQQTAVVHEREQAPRRVGTEDTEGRGTGGEERPRPISRAGSSLSSGSEVFPEAEPLEQLSARLDATHIEDLETGGTSSVQRDEKLEAGRGPEPLPLSSPASPERATSAIGDVAGLEVSRLSGAPVGEVERLACPQSEKQSGGMLTGTAVLETSRCADDVDVDSREALPDAAATSDAAASDEANDDSRGRNHSSISAATTGSENTINRDAAEEGLTRPEAEGGRRSPLEPELERKLPARENGGCGQAVLPDGLGVDSAGGQTADGDGDRSVDSGLRSASPAPLDGSATAASKGSEEVDASGNSGTSEHCSGSLRRGGVSQEGLRRHSGRGPRDHRSRSHGGGCGGSGSPELVWLGSASQDSDGTGSEERSSDLRAWGAGAAGGSRNCRGDHFFDGDDDEAGLSLPRGAAGAEMPEKSRREDDESAVGPDVGGSRECDGLDALSLSPLALADLSGANDVGGDACSGEGGRSCGSSSGEGGGGGRGWDACYPGERVECGLSPVGSVRSDSTFEFDDGPSSAQRSRVEPFLLEEEEEEEDEEEVGDSGDSGEITLSPAASRSSPFAHASVCGDGAGDHAWGDQDDVSTGVDEADGGLESGSLMPPPPPRRPSLAMQVKGRGCQKALTPETVTPPRKSLTPEQRSRGPSSRNPRVAGPARPAFRDRTNEGWYNGGDDSRDGNSPSGVTGRSCFRDGSGGRGARGGADYNEQASIGSFTESEAGGSRLGESVHEGFDGGDKENGDGSSLVEGTPRRGGVGSSEGDLGGYYPPLQVASTATATAPESVSLSTLQRSTLQWMAWRERGEKEEEEERGGGARGQGSESLAAATASFSSGDSSNAGADTDVKGGVLGHLSSEEASACVHALLKGGVAPDDHRGGTTDRGGQRRAHPGTGLPRGRTLILAPTKEAAWRWSDRLESGAGGLSVLSYVMPLRERRRISAKQAAAFDVVVTTYDVLKAKEVPRGVDSSRATSPRRWALPGSSEWRTRNDKEERQKRPAACKTDHLVSVLHGVWWDRIVADEAQILATQRSARAAAALSLVGTTRWCVVERGSMGVVESSSERMRSLAAFLRVPADVPMVHAAESLFYASRPRHVAPLHPRGTARGAADDSLSLHDGNESRRSSPSASPQERGSCSRKSGAGHRQGVNNDDGGRAARSSTAGMDRSAGRKGRGLGMGVTGNGGVEIEGRGVVGKKSSRTGSGTGNALSEDGGCESEGNRRRPGAGFAGREALSRGHVTYAATTLRLRRTGGVGGVVQFG